eukprot:CAMPEP_0185750000 /NCGR_PEP_ID=MMETSP1174-20130828/8716_1 /TAXON_ID=35687 /ORGANISM="Dictyocha speculum, Strain CCMP1381" /LENGTH=172 /DNA_ID=CAMNT_0028426347 /DNA_START=48 /DNA_END=566 /DNA_ORIENTATION=-
MISEMRLDIFHIFRFALVFICGFSAALHQFQIGNEMGHSASPFGIYHILFQATLGDSSEAMAMLGESSEAMVFFPKTIDAHFWIGYSLMVAFQLLVPLVLINTLIVMMSATYERVEGAKEGHWMLQRASIMQSIIDEMGVGVFESDLRNRYWVVLDGKRYLTWYHEDKSWGS